VSIHFDAIGPAVAAVYIYKHKKAPTSIESALLTVYEAANISTRVRISKGFPYIAEALSLHADKGDQLFIDYGLMEKPGDEDVATESAPDQEVSGVST
jgi:hypothetical protein